MEKLVLPELLFTFLSLNLYIFDFVLVRLYGFSLKTDAKIMILSLSDKYLSVFLGFFRFIILTLQSTVYKTSQNT